MTVEGFSRMDDGYLLHTGLLQVLPSERISHDLQTQTPVKFVEDFKKGGESLWWFLKSKRAQNETLMLSKAYYLLLETSKSSTCNSQKQPFTSLRHRMKLILGVLLFILLTLLLIFICLLVHVNIYSFT